MLQLRVLEKLIMSRDPEQKNKGSNQQKRRFNSSAASTPFSQILPQDMGLWLVGGFNTPGQNDCIEDDEWWRHRMNIIDQRDSPQQWGI